MTDVRAQRGAFVRSVAVTGSLMILLYALLYFPYPEGSFPVRVLSTYLELIASVCGLLIGLADPSIRVETTVIHGRFPLQIVLDCAAVDAQAFFLAAVVGFPARWSVRAAGVGGGLLVITLANLARIVALYFVGLRWPASFHFWHEDVLQFAMVLVAVVAFAMWVLWARRISIEAAHAG